MAGKAETLGGPSRTGIRRSKIGRVSQNPGRKLQTSSSDLSTSEILRIFRSWGIHTLGQLAALDKEELRNRLGNEAVRLWERANGTATRPLKFVQPPETFHESYEFDHEIETAEPLLFILRRFLEQLALRLGSIYLVARELTLTIHFSGSHQDKPAMAGKETHIRLFKIPQPTNDIDLLFRMLHTHLENFKSDHPIVAVALSAEPIRPVSQQFGLFETALRNPHQLYETLARLTALVGNDRVGTPVLEETHRPDAFRMENFNWSPIWTGGFAADTDASINKCDGHRPPLQKEIALRRFRPPANAAIFISQNRYLSGEAPECRRDNASPARTCRHRRSEKVHGQIIDQVGPFLLSGNWWDEKAWARAEYDMQLEGGEMIRAHQANEKWAIDGIYD
jgi:protein ImuB